MWMEVSYTKRMSDCRRCGEIFPKETRVFRVMTKQSSATFCPKCVIRALLLTGMDIDASLRQAKEELFEEML